ncbi:aspartate carbamoyltransferase catalytic subunit [Pseudooceanicola sp.]|uniref:aspartate carbamoyltransferase catalytic subunit n=1 Tax=Pseudooceanicola sp. TaxID=1914328 RepID=UPI002611B93F|nr:aspartate carbamoyltransferase catalytic subunit [Pseudooceanicola sp.]MDF1856515.1 aspartate carbamoyltransferase catalytic subunit [Pseudooceanicola sp.]
MSAEVTHQARGDGWDGILDPGEVIQWQGRPDPAVKFQLSHIVTVVFGLLFSGFALFWMITAARSGDLFWMFGLIHFSVGLSILIGPIYGPSWRRRHTWYTLTDRRAFIATDIPFRGRKLTAYPIAGDTVISIEEADDFSTVHFAHEMKSRKNGSTRHDIGFERIPDGRDVYARLRAIRAAAA